MYRVRNVTTGELLDPEFDTAADAQAFADNILGDDEYRVEQV